MEGEDIFSMKEKFIITYYGTLYERCLEIPDKIKEMMPDYQTRLNQDMRLQMLKYNYPEMTENELLAHAYTASLMIYFMFGIMI